MPDSSLSYQFRHLGHCGTIISTKLSVCSKQQRIMQQTSSCSGRGAHCFCASGQRTIRCRQRAPSSSLQTFPRSAFCSSEINMGFAVSPPASPTSTSSQSSEPFLLPRIFQTDKKAEMGWKKHCPPAAAGNMAAYKFWPGQDGRKPFICKFQGIPIKASTEQSLN